LKEAPLPIFYTDDNTPLTNDTLNNTTKDNTNQWANFENEETLIDLNESEISQLDMKVNEKLLFYFLIIN
jgi:hypothetical protein